ncbi:MAG: type II secretion system protein GspN, partial [Syntrophaceae bacterium]|nr:type II secretion system protein GspN [Syntrophaceae bacterium]
MKATPGKWLKLSRIGYFAAAALMFLFFLYLRFPGEAVTGYFQAAFAARFPQARLTLETVRPALPPGLRTDQAAVHFSGRSGALFHAEGLTIRPSGLSLLQGRMSLLAEALGYGGKLEGRIAFQRLFSLQGPFTAEVAFGEIRTEQIVWLKEALSRPLTGRLQGTLQYSGGTGESLQSGTGQLDFTMVNGSYPLRESLFGIDRVDFSRI